MDVETVETWEIQTEGTVWVRTKEPRTGGYAMTRVGGAGAKRLRISTEDREYNSELIPEENRGSDPFTNGMLVRLVDGERVGGLTDQDLRDLLGVHGEAFAEAVAELDSELSVRRLKAIAEEHATVAQLGVVNDYVEAHYKVGGTQRTVCEMITAGEAVGGTIIS